MAMQDFNNNNASLLLDTGEGHQYDRKKHKPSSSDPTGESIMNSAPHLRGCFLILSKILAIENHIFDTV